MQTNNFISLSHSHTGFHCLKANGTGTTTQNNISVDSQKEYRISGFVKFTDSVTVYIKNNNSELKNKILIPGKLNEYAYWSFRFGTGSETHINVEISTGTLTDTVYLDNIYMDKVVNNTNESADPETHNFTADSDPTTTTDPLSTDTDGDTIPDNVEDSNHNGKVDKGPWGSGGETDPNKKDTDGDGMPDNREINYENIWMGDIGERQPDPRNPDTQNAGGTAGSDFH